MNWNALITAPRDGTPFIILGDFGMKTERGYWSLYIVCVLEDGLVYHFDNVDGGWGTENERVDDLESWVAGWLPFPHPELLSRKFRHVSDANSAD